MGESRDPDGAGSGRSTKVARLLDEYDLDGLGAELERRWTADEDRWSLRDLASLFNRRLLEAALDRANVQTLDGEVANVYRLLTSDEVTSADRTRVRRRLERDGIDVDTLVDDFVTYQAIRTYLKEDRGAEYTPDETDPIERELGNVRQLRGRVDSVTEGKVEQLRDADHLTLGEFRTIVDVQVYCEDCNTQLAVETLLERGGCNCG